MTERKQIRGISDIPAPKMGQLSIFIRGDPAGKFIGSKNQLNRKNGYLVGWGLGRRLGIQEVDKIAFPVAKIVELFHDTADLFRTFQRNFFNSSLPCAEVKLNPLYLLGLKAEELSRLQRRFLKAGKLKKQDLPDPNDQKNKGREKKKKFPFNKTSPPNMESNEVHPYLNIDHRYCVRHKF